MGADGLSAGEELEDGFGRGAGGYVEVLGFEAEEKITDAASCEEGLGAGAAQRTGDTACGAEGGSAGEAQDHTDPKLR